MGVFSAYAFAFGLAIMGQEGAVDPLPPAPIALEDVLVDGRRLDEASRDYVRAIGDSPPRGALPGRWTKPLCISVVNLKAPFAQQMIDGIAKAASDVGLEVRGPGCVSNVLIVGTDNGSQTASYLVEGARDRFRSGVDRANNDLNALQRFRESDAAVRWWHISFPRVRETGEFAGRGGGVRKPGQIANPESDGGGGSQIPFSFLGGASSLIAPSVRYDTETVTVVVDFSKTENVSMYALTDYVAMVVLAQIDPRADFSLQPSILSLFETPTAVGGLTDWDRDYLQAVYSGAIVRNTIASHEGEVARRLASLQRVRQQGGVGPQDETKR